MTTQIKTPKTEGNPKILALANHIGRKKPGAKDAYDYDAPEYRILEPVVTDEMAEICMTFTIREKVTAEAVAERTGKAVADCHRILLELADVGVCFVNTINGKDTFWYDTWVPGIMEMMTNHPTNAKKFPQIAEAFEAYGRIRGAKTAGMTPVGIGLMRVIPIEKAIDGESRRASYEELSKHIEEHDLFSLSDCSCRTAREIMGEGCGHLKEDMCIQMGHAAEYYIRTGRGRQVTKDEVYKILRRAEENGLMHEIPNLDGDGKTHAICNCCGCGCFSMRTAEMFLNADMVRSNYVSQVDRDKCVACGQCVENCPVNALQLGQRVCSTKPVIDKIVHKDTPRDTEWTSAHWNPEYRTNRKNVVDTGTAPCKTECPAHIGIQGYIKLAAQGRYTDALELIKKENPFPAVCGRICNRRCESACTRGDIDEPIAIDEIKKFIAEQDLNKDRRFVPIKRHAYGKKIAVIGGGPAGLTCAYFLAIDGYKVTVFEKQQKPGGMLAFGIPAFRLQKDVVEAEIGVLSELGVTFRTGVEVGRDVTIEALRKDGYEAFYLAIGAQGGRRLGLDGEQAEGILSGIDFVRRVNLGEDIRLSGKVVVIGGGNVAVDVARTAVRKGASEVTMICLESEAEMPASPDEVEEAVHEGISIRNGWGPCSFEMNNERVSGVNFRRCVSVFDANHRFAPVYDDTQTMLVDADWVLLSIGQSIEWGELLTGTKVERNPNGTVRADSFTYQTAEPDIFAGGDVFSGPKFAIDAIAAGKQAAISIHRFVQPGQSLVIGRDKREYKSLDKAALELDSYDRMPRQQAAVSHTVGFVDGRGTLTEEQVKKETERCLGCGAVVVDDFLCVGCGQCTTKCKFEAISLTRRYNGEGVSLLDMKKKIIPHVLKRKVKIALKKIKSKLHQKK
ncbi:MAG: FAD-dependent oxidoreductase [Clostridia bacterium]|nr:FAD-dependent oxidoreductase [Clostridia bacterium]